MALKQKKILRVSDNQSKISLNKILTTLHICIYEGGGSWVDMGQMVPQQFAQ